MAAEPRIDSICSMMRRAILSMREELDRKRTRLFALESLIAGLKANPNADPALLTQLRSELARLQAEMESDIPQLNAFEEEYSAECGHIPL